MRPNLHKGCLFAEKLKTSLKALNTPMGERYITFLGKRFNIKIFFPRRYTEQNPVKMLGSIFLVAVITSISKLIVNYMEM